MNIFEQVKESITTKQAAIHYGINVNQNDKIGRASCRERV